MVRLHALQGVDEHSTTLHINLTALCDNTALNGAPWPEGMPHLTPWIGRVCAERTSAVGAHLESRCSLGYLYIDDTVLIGSPLETIRCPVFAQIERDTVGEEAISVGREAVVADAVARPKMRCLITGIHNLRVELSGSPYTPSTDILARRFSS
jgi:hypothetical protein